MATKRNHGVVYSGSIKGALRRPSPRKFCTNRRVTKKRVTLRGGPLHGHSLYLADTSCTLPIAIGDQCGRYVMGEYVGKFIGFSWQSA